MPWRVVARFRAFLNEGKKACPINRVQSATIIYFHHDHIERINQARPARQSLMSLVSSASGQVSISCAQHSFLVAFDNPPSRWLVMVTTKLSIGLIGSDPHAFTRVGRRRMK